MASLSLNLGYGFRTHTFRGSYVWLHMHMWSIGDRVFESTLGEGDRVSLGRGNPGGRDRGSLGVTNPGGQRQGALKDGGGREEVSGNIRIGGP